MEVAQGGGSWRWLKGGGSREVLKEQLIDRCLHAIGCSLKLRLERRPRLMPRSRGTCLLMRIMELRRSRLHARLHRAARAEELVDRRIVGANAQITAWGRLWARRLWGRLP